MVELVELVELVEVVVICLFYVVCVCLFVCLLCPLTLGVVCMCCIAPRWQGVTERQVLLALSSGGVLTMNKKWFDARR